MKLSLRAKVGLAFAGLIGLLLFLIVVDLGVNAGRIHYGVSIAGVDLGGLTRVEAAAPVRSRGREIRNAPILLTAEGLNVGIPPRCMGWRPAVRPSIRRAYDVGRDDAPFGALWDRAGSWLWGTRVDYAGRWTSTALLEAYLDQWDERLASLGGPLDRERLLRLLEGAVAEGRTGPIEFPRESASSTARSASSTGLPLAPATARRQEAPLLASGSAPRSAPGKLARRAPLLVRQEVPRGCPDPAQEAFAPTG